jgi:hypothetical protein
VTWASGPCAHRANVKRSILRALPYLCASAFICGLTLSAAAAPDPRIEKITERVLSAQVPPGGIANTPRDVVQSRTFLTSYNFGGLALVRAYELTNDPNYAAAARRFIEFWLAHQNHQPDRFGVTGTMYDQDYWRDDGGTLEPHVYDKSSPPNTGGPGYDAADADPPIIAITAARYVRATHDLALLQSHADGWLLIERAMTAMLDRDGLTWAHPKYRIKYLMDAVEVQVGFGALADIWRALGDEANAARNQKLADQVKAGIASLWSNKTGCYDWNRDEVGAQQACDWRNVYPDTMEQLWPAVWGVEDAHSPHSRAAWSAFVQHWPRWSSEDRLLGWPHAAVVGLRLDGADKNGAREQVNRILSKRMNDDSWEVNQMYFALIAVAGE